MPRDLFGDVVDPSITLGTRKWYSVPLSFIVHTAVVIALIAAPLMATGVLPTPSDGMTVIDLATPPLPQPPPVRRATPPQARVNRDAAPLVAPDTIAPEPELPPAIESGGTDFDITDVSAIEGDSAAVPPPPPVRDDPPLDKPVRAGGQVRVPERIAYVPPIYPTIALAARVRGLVIIDATIGTDGRVKDARVLRSDSPLLSESALAAVRAWVYTPTLLNGVPVTVVMTVTVNFQMQ